MQPKASGGFVTDLDQIISELRSEIAAHTARQVYAAGNTAWPPPVKVSVCLPETHTACLAFCGYAPGWRACFFNREYKFLFEGTDITEMVTHWMPNPPNPPKK